MRTNFLLTVLFFSCTTIVRSEADSTVEHTALADTVEYLHFSESEYEHIPGEADFDLINDRLSCIQNVVPLHYNNKVHAFVNYFAVRDREYTRLMIKRKNLYFPLFEKYLKKYGIPEELKYLAIVESGLNPTAVSRASAVGLWQFMSFTGRHFGLHQDWYIDERMDPEQSTEAACKYLKQLYGMFGDWELAIAAYNTGPGNIRRAIRRSGGKKTFWEIYPYIHRETRAYLPQFIAIAYIMNYASEHNFLEENLEYQMEMDTIRVSDYLHLETFANQVNVCPEDLQKLNPALKRNVVPDSKSGYWLRVPADVKNVFAQNRLAILDSAGKVGKAEIARLAANSVGSTYGRNRVTYRVRSGDVLGTIAQRHNVRVSDLKSWNNLRGNMIRVGQTLTIWSRGGNSVAKTAPPVLVKSPDGSKLYVVQPGDTLWDISRKFDGLTLAELKKINRLESNNIKPGQKLIVGR